VEGCVAALAAVLVAELEKHSLTIATAESCTGGAISQAITSVPGSSAVMRGAVVAYHNDVKSNVLGVGVDVLAAKGAVSEEVVRLMACGVAQLMNVECAIATSGIAGPGGGTPEKPVGTVWVAVKSGNHLETVKLQLPDEGRLANVRNAVLGAMQLMLDVLVCKD
jgi:PncC family amidohydrolase